jgi:hypothetical protein
MTDKDPEKHALKIESLRDLKASCACGRWHYARPASDSESDSQLIGAADRQHGLHIGRLD